MIISNTAKNEPTRLKVTTRLTQLKNFKNLTQHGYKTSSHIPCNNLNKFQDHSYRTWAYTQRRLRNNTHFPHIQVKPYPQILRYYKISPNTATKPLPTSPATTPASFKIIAIESEPTQSEDYAIKHIFLILGPTGTLRTDLPLLQNLIMITVSENVGDSISDQIVMVPSSILCNISRFLFL